MSEQILENEITEIEVEENSREYWKERANLLGITYPVNITTPKLQELVQKTMAENDAKQSATGTRGITRIEKLAPEVIKAQDDALALVRFKLTVLDPNKSSLSGMIFSVGNDNIAPVKRTIPFNTEVWHAERIIVDYMKGMKYQQLKSKWNDRMKANFDDPASAKLMPCFHIEELPPLTEEELRELAEVQMAQGTGEMKDLTA